VIGVWRELLNEEVHDLYPSPCIMRVLMPRRIRWAGHVVFTGRIGMRIGFWWEHQKKDTTGKI
jgi:hypothetical protein